MHAPSPSHSLSVQTLPSSAHACAAGSAVQVDEQQSPLTLLPSSQSSPGSGTPFPQRSGSTQLASAAPLSNMSQKMPRSSASLSTRQLRHKACASVQSAKPGDEHSPGNAAAMFTP